MSKVLQQAKQHYKKALLAEFLLFILFFLSLVCWQWQQARDFALGFWAVFLPFGLFVYFVFFSKSKLSTKISTFYWAEAMKFGLTIILIILAFKVFVVTQFVLFFIGFFLALVLNNLVPFMLRKF